MSENTRTGLFLFGCSISYAAGLTLNSALILAGVLIGAVCIFIAIIY